MEFIKSTLGEIALEIKTGKTPPTSNPEYFGDELNWYTPTDLDREKILGDSKRRITQKALNDKKVVLLKPNTILLGCIGDIGKIGLIKESASSNQQITGILPKEEIVNSEFLYYWLKNNKNRLRDTSTSAIVPILNNKQLSTIKIEFPKLIKDQIRIAQILTQAENLITQRKESISLLDELLKSTFWEMFGDPVRNEKGWEIEIIKNLLCKSSINGHYVPKEQYLPNGTEMVHMSDLFYNIVPRGKLKRVLIPEKEIEKYSVTEFDLLIARRSLTFEGAAKACLIPKSDEPLVFESSMIKLSPDLTKILPIYLFYYLNNDRAKSNYILKHITKSTISGINQSNLNKVEVILPPLKLQNQFATIVEKVGILKTEYQASLKELENMYGVLSQKAFKGELKVKE